MFRLLALTAAITLMMGVGAEERDSGYSERVYLVVGSFNNMQGAIDLERRLEKTFTGVQTESRLMSNSVYNRVLIGPVSKENIATLKLHLQAQGVSGTWTVPENEISLASSTREAGFIQPIDTNIDPSATPADQEREPEAQRVRTRMTGQSSAEAAASEAAAPKPIRKREPYNPATLVLPEKKDS